MNTPSILPLICEQRLTTPVVLDPVHPLPPTSTPGFHLPSGKHPKARDGWYKWERENTSANVEIDFDAGNTQLPSTGAYDKMVGDSYYASFLILLSAWDYATCNYRRQCSHCSSPGHRWNSGGMKTDMGIPNTLQKPAPMPHYPAQIPYWLLWEQILIYAVFWFTSRLDGYLINYSGLSI